MSKKKEKHYYYSLGYNLCKPCAIAPQGFPFVLDKRAVRVGIVA
jgi:hypothetical protein